MASRSQRDDTIPAFNEYANRPWRFMIVDDDPVIAQKIKGYLSFMGDFEILYSPNGPDGLATLQKDQDIDFVFVDIMMPGMGGVEFLSRLKANDREIVAAVITGSPSMELIVDTMRAGASDFLSKPFKFDQFQITVKRMIRERSLILENRSLSQEVKMKAALEEINRKLEKKVEEQRVLFAISDALGKTKSTSELYSTLVNMAAALTEANQAFLWILNHQNGTLTLMASKGPYDRSLAEIPMESSNHPCVKVVHDGVALIIDRKSGEDGTDNGMLIRHFAGDELVLVPFHIRDELFGILGVSGGTDQGLSAEETLFLLHLLSERASLTVENLLLYDSILFNLHATLRALVRSLEAKDPYTKLHSERVTDLALRIAEEMGCSPESIESLRFAGHLHDIGKIGIRDEILMKPGRLTKEEFEIIKTHPVIGAEIVSHLGLLPEEKAIIRHHHERWDGKGYPDGLLGEETPLLSRILAVADTYDAITSHRPYRTAQSHEFAFEQIRSNGGTQFDPEVVKAFCSLCSRTRKLVG